MRDRSGRESPVGTKNKLEDHLSLYHSPGYSCTVCVQSSLEFEGKNIFTKGHKC